jgi:hypothetical protein
METHAALVRPLLRALSDYQRGRYGARCSLIRPRRLGAQRTEEARRSPASGDAPAPHQRRQRAPNRPRDWQHARRPEASSATPPNC